MLKLQDIHKSYRIGPVEVEILKGVSLNVNPGDFISIVGSSGCGKSTLMNILGFLDVPTSGQYFFDGKETSNLNETELSRIRNYKIGFVFSSITNPSIYRFLLISSIYSSSISSLIILQTYGALTLTKSAILF